MVACPQCPGLGNTLSGVFTYVQEGMIALKKSKEARHTKVSVCVLQLHDYLFHFFHIFLTMTGDFKTRGKGTRTLPSRPHLDVKCAGSQKTRLLIVP